MSMNRQDQDLLIHKIRWWMVRTLWEKGETNTVAERIGYLPLNAWFNWPPGAETEAYKDPRGAYNRMKLLLELEEQQ
jgi:hypothetical protein